jgi:general secretion pathway protein G
VAAPPSGGGGQGGGGGPGGGGGDDGLDKPRKDRFLVPINSDYDLYSMGPDGESKRNLNTPVSRDDVIRARDGAYIGVAELF